LKRKKPLRYNCTIKSPKGKICGKSILVSKRSEHQKQHKKSRTASGTGIASHEAAKKHLQKKYPKALIIRTGKEAAIPDFVLFNRGKVSFYELKPLKGDKLLKRDQRDWIKKNCLQKKLKAFLIIYEKNKDKFNFKIKKLDYNRIKEYCCSSKK
jgi:hypothetical protein